MRRSRWWAPAVGASLLVAGLASVSDAKPPVKNRCTPTPAVWSWKANGYALHDDAAKAEALAKQRATDDACARSRKHLEGRKLKCPAACKQHGVEEACEVQKEKCTKGTYEGQKGMWKFVCRKVHQKVKGEDPCTEQHAKSHPGFGMCDIGVKASKAPTCVEVP